MKKGIIPEFKRQTIDSILELLAEAGKRQDIDCINYTKFVPMTADLPVYAFVSKHDIVFVLIDWGKPQSRVASNAVNVLTDFMRMYVQAVKKSTYFGDIPPFIGVIVSNYEYSDLDLMAPILEEMDIMVFHHIKALTTPEVHYNMRYHAVALALYKAFRSWCEKRRYIEKEPYDIDDIDADYNEREFGLDKDDNEIDYNFNFDDEDDFENILKKFDEGPIPSLFSDENKEKKLPFPKEMSDIVADISLGNMRNETEHAKDIDTITINIQSSQITPREYPIKITITSKSETSIRPHRFFCYVYTDSYYPICSGNEGNEIKSDKERKMIIEIPCQRIWLPGNYILIINDSQDFTSVKRIDFTLDDELSVVSQREWEQCGIISPECSLSLCLAQAENWEYIAHTPGTSQIRQKVIQRIQAQYFNEFRKESLGNLPICGNMLVCMNTPSRMFLKKLSSLMVPEYDFRYIDCSKLFDISRTNPYELLQEALNDVDKYILCLNHIGELTTSSGKVIMRKILETINDSSARTFIWLCGTRQEIDEILNTYPSIKKLFHEDSWLIQQPNTAYELVQAFIDIMANYNIEPDILAQEKLAKSIMQGCDMRYLSDWTTDEINSFIESEIIPRYIKRNVAEFNMKDKKPLVIMEDIPFEKLTDSVSDYEQSIIGLNTMIGLEEVKRGISTMANQAHLFLERRRRGLKTSNKQVYHSIFTGNPGTGKTTVARQLGKIYHALGLLSKGEVIAVDRTKLIGQYIGQTEENMKSILEEAKGNVLFIDEAYTLFTGSEDSKDFGRRVIDCLLTILTQPNPDMLIVFAGYTKEMDAMLNTNPGLAGRFPYRYHFEDYSPEQLMEIAKKIFEREEYTLTNQADQELQKSIADTIKAKPNNFGNARWVEQFVRNGIIPAMADRIFSIGCNDYQTIEACDIRKAFEKFNPKTLELKPRHRVAGFSA